MPIQKLKSLKKYIQIKPLKHTKGSKSISKIPEEDVYTRIKGKKQKID